MTPSLASLEMKTPFGPISLLADGKSLLEIHFGRRRGTRGHSPVIEKARQQLEEYFEGKRTKFSLPYRLEGSEFEKEVWTALESVPFGKLVSYGELAKRLGKPDAARAVGGALGKNPLPILLPCHRVVAAGKRWGGFGGGLSVKRWLLDLEGSSAELKG